MFLKNITIKGFKSFANKVKVDFEPAITGVIGPNGSGKSNISDAIRWVLGEQSAKTLRGAKMEDVIFAGSSKRRALGIAEVTLTLDNRDGSLPIEYKEVTVGRRVSRSGESDYLINNNQCRLKDIKELFMDTGVGKDAYSIIGQGKVETILSENSTDRRELFEEAAGISKHKSRKEEAEKKLDSTEQKLQRIEDIVREIERQVGPLEKESKKAEEYIEYKSELKEIEVNLLSNKYMKLEEQLDQDIANKQRLSYQLTESKAAVNEYDLRIDKEKESLEELSVSSDRQKDKIFEAKSNVERIENKLELARQQKSNLLDQGKRLRDEIVKLEDKIEFFREEINNKDEKRRNLLETINEQSLLLDEKEEELSSISIKLEEKLNIKKEFQDNQLNQINKINKEKHELETANREIERHKKEIAKLEDSKRDLKVELDEIQREKKLKEEKLTEIKLNLQENKEKAEEEKLSNNKLQQELNNLRDEYDDFKDRVKSKESRLKVLEGMEENYQGYYRGVKNLLKYVKESNQLQGVCGVLAELIDTPKDYETAIEVALGSALQNIVVEDDRVGKKAISYLKKNRGGRATFLPLNLVSSRYLNSREKDALDINGAIGVARDLVSFSDKYKSVVDNLLGRVIIAKDIDAAVKISKAADKRVKVVSLDGDVVNPGGSMTGGSRNQNNNILGRSREIEDLSKEVKELNIKLSRLEKKGIEKKENLVKSEDSLTGLNKRIHSLEIEATNYSKDYQQVSRDLIRLKDEINNRDNELEELKVSISSLRDKIKVLTRSLDNLTDDDSNIKDVIFKVEEDIKSLESKKEGLSKEITDLKVRIASLKQEKENISEEINSKEKSITDAENEIKNKEEEITRFKQKVDSLDSKQDELLKEKEEMSQKVIKLKEDLDNFRTESKKIKAKIDEYQKESKDIRSKYEKVQEEYNKIKVDLAQLQVKLENIENRLQEEYELEVYEITSEVEEIKDYDKAEKTITKLKRSMKRLEPVNLGAIEEYETLSQRFNFLKEQHQDLVESKESLEEVIGEIEEEMKEKFINTFKQVKVEFEKIFTDLFEGGQAELNLEDEEDLLTTGIEINAQPPGKKLQKLSLMSGGEKALTATALIFSLLKVNPSPFYVLDELDAPLDDANVNRFAEYLRRLSEMAQFIVITHRKGTMAAVNALYGVTMQESGVSQLVSLNMEELEEYEE
ncbi:chromosome segregation protein SMC [Orenia marismortui]|uniref:chromosome segregation protein SMC n=1 Tax=Orenia marismortui TaxID=46469 RepID=UPI00036F9859|nr:chromosome segregation protein SMC [Orenia marismortui]